ncbi:MAG: NAD(P)H-dependent glycerol-3-phosphate dehydrogenase [Planctomycetaceae bacterium]
MTTKIAIIGGGAMATACALLLSERSDQRVALWMRNSEFAEQVQKTRENRRLLAGVLLPGSVDVTADIGRAVAGADLLVVAIPSKFLRTALTDLMPDLPPGVPVVSVIKGIEVATFLRPSEVIAEVLGTQRILALGGPSHAEEIARRLPASVVAASDDLELAQQVQDLFTTGRFRVYTNRDLKGVEFGGALKNVVAIAAGICDGLDYGDNAKSALLTRGLVEMTRFGTRLGADSATFSGLAGMGDLITTCTSPFGRNRYVGQRLGQGLSLSEVLEEMDAVAEGITTARSVHDMGLRHEIDMPIMREVYRVLFENRSPEQATQNLMLRPPKGE